MVRILGYRNRENMGRFADAIAAFEANPQENATTCPGFNYGSNNADAPDLCWARKPNVKKGIGMFAEQSLTRDIGVFARGMYSDGQTEVYAYTSTDRSFPPKPMSNGSKWSRPRDITGVGYNLGWISKIHAENSRGGVDGFNGDGGDHRRAEKSFDVFTAPTIGRRSWLTGDYQHRQPCSNAARGPVNNVR